VLFGPKFCAFWPHILRTAGGSNTINGAELQFTEMAAILKSFSSITLLDVKSLELQEF
jgi:hypothetical protein